MDWASGVGGVSSAKPRRAEPAKTKHEREKDSTWRLRMPRARSTKRATLGGTQHQMVSALRHVDPLQSARRRRHEDCTRRRQPARQSARRRASLDCNLRRPATFIVAKWAIHRAPVRGTAHALRMAVRRWPTETRFMAHLQSVHARRSRRRHPLLQLQQRSVELQLPALHYFETDSLDLARLRASAALRDAAQCSGCCSVLRQRFDRLGSALYWDDDPKQLISAFDPADREPCSLRVLAACILLHGRARVVVSPFN